MHHQDSYCQGKNQRQVVVQVGIGPVLAMVTVLSTLSPLRTSPMSMPLDTTSSGVTYTNECMMNMVMMLETNTTHMLFSP